MDAQTTELPKPWIQFTFEGVVALCVSDRNSSGGVRTTFDAGIIKGQNSNSEIPYHNYSIEIKKWRNGQLVNEDGFPVRYSASFGTPAPDVLELQIGTLTTAEPLRGIKLFDGGNDKDFEKVIDVENRMHDEKQVQIVPKALRTVLRVIGARDSSGAIISPGVSHAVFYAEVVNNVDVPIENIENPNDELCPIKGAAETVGAKVYLPESGAKLFVQGTDVPICTFAHQRNVTYEFTVKNNCEVEECITTDITGFYNGLIGDPKKPGVKKVRFKKRKQGDGKNPDLILSLTGTLPCDVLNFGISQNLPDPE